MPMMVFVIVYVLVMGNRNWVSAQVSRLVTKFAEKPGFLGQLEMLYSK